MNGKILSVTIILIMVLGSFGAVGKTIATEKNNPASVNVSDGDGVVDRWAVLVGTDPSVFSTDDVQDMYNTLKGNGWDAENIKMYKERKAFKADIFSGISWMAEQADSDDIVLFYFSGHGARRVIADYYGNPIFLIELKQRFQRGKSYFSLGTQQVLIFDTCHAGSLRDAEEHENLVLKYFNYTGEYPPEDPDIEEKGLFGLSGLGRILIASSGSSQYSYGDKELSNGIFSYYFINGLINKEVDKNTDGWISAEEAFDYTKPLTKARTRQFIISQQSPEISDGILGQVNLSNAGRRSRDLPLTLQKLSLMNSMILSFLRKLFV